jgi:hypothetical protein
MGDQLPYAGPAVDDQSPYPMPPADGQPPYGVPPVEGQPPYGVPPVDGQSYVAPPLDGQPPYAADPVDGRPPYAAGPVDGQPPYAAGPVDGRPAAGQFGNVAGQPGNVGRPAGNGDSEAPAAAVRAYVWTGGRTRSHYNFEVETLVTAAEQAGAAGDVTQPEQAVLELCREPVSVAEVAALLAMPLGVTKVLLGDMADRGLIVVHGTTSGADDALATGLMERVLTGLRRL